MNQNLLINHIVFIVHYFPPINSSGAKRVEALSKYFSRAGRTVTVITTRKRASDGAFTESFPPGVEVLQLDWLGRNGESTASDIKYEPMYTGKPTLKRRIKDLVMKWFGQLPDPRLPFALSFLSPFLDPKVRTALTSADVVIGSCPPWSMLLAAFFASWRFNKRCVLDYRDHFSECHEMPGSPLAKAVEKRVDSALAARAEALVTISEPMATYYSKLNPRVSVVMNGYDPERIERAMAEAAWSPRTEDRPVIIRYLGIVSPGRVPRHFLAALNNSMAQGLIKETSLRFEFYGSCAVLESELNKYYPRLLPLFKFPPTVSYHEALKLIITSDYLLFSETSSTESISAQGILTTKLFEYLASGRPVIADISPTTLAGGMITKAGGYHFVSNLEQDFDAFLASPQFLNPPKSMNTPFVQTLSRAHQAGQYLSSLDSMTYDKPKAI
jgi:glycosyltransferase involved in cell wall biosynthesis